MRIPLPRVPEWWSSMLDWLNEDLCWRVRRIDPLLAGIFAAAIAIDGTYVQGWERALLLDPPLMVFSWLTGRWFI